MSTGKFFLSDAIRHALGAWDAHRNSPTKVKERVLRGFIERGDFSIEMQSELMLKGWETYYKENRSFAHASNMAVAVQVKLVRDAFAKTRGEMSRKFAAERRAKIKVFDRVVEALDAETLNGKQLGDCTRPEFLREASRLEQSASAASVQSVFYRSLAALCDKDKTLRQSTDRAGIVKLLTSRYKEDAE